MGATPTTDNKLADFFDGLIKAGISGGEVAMKAFILTTPEAWLEGPFIGFFTDEIIKAIGNALFAGVADFSDKIVIDFQVNGENSAVMSATLALREAKASGRPDAIAQANEAFNAAVASLIHSDGTSHRS